MYKVEYLITVPLHSGIQFATTPTRPAASARPLAAASGAIMQITTFSMLTDSFNLRSSAFICGSFSSNTKNASFSIGGAEQLKIFKSEFVEFVWSSLFMTSLAFACWYERRFIVIYEPQFIADFAVNNGKEAASDFYRAP